jgi:undecaprenyl diphosphate synthase
MKNPEHVAITMDGNRRWALDRGLTTFEGHLSGAQRIEPIVKEASEEGISHLSLYAFSTENWERTDEEKDNIMKVFRHMLKDPVVDRFKEQGVRVKILGDYGKFPSDIVDDIEDLEKDSETNNRITVNFALGYGGHDEVARATNKLIEKGVTHITPELIESHLDTAGQPPVDLMIRTGGAQRTSGFLMWESTYAELYFTDILWPDFEPPHFQDALTWYDPANRRFGK